MPESPKTEVLLGVTAVLHSSALRELMEKVQRIAQSQAAVMIVGETGSGKEIIARALHHYSLRCSKPWVDVNCAALPEHLVESELFGYEKGAFSGAESSKPGFFELAHTGTLFLDEVGELEPKTQVKLLRVLDGTPYYRLGGLRKVSVDVRVIAASNRSLEEATEAGAFRRDLYHRLCQIQLKVPPLRDRRDDIVPLAEFFLQQQYPEMKFSSEVLQTLLQYSWPGNVRELRNVVLAAAALARNNRILLEDLPANVPQSATAKPGTPSQPSISVEAVEDASEEDEPLAPLDEMEKNLIMRTLNQTEGHQQRAAQMLGISRRTLSRKLKAYAFDQGR
ncbi:MAG TPA: sigma-54 dependent transcriptional regulator [Terriglobales bacterium]